MTAMRTKTSGIVMYLLIIFAGAWLLEIIGWRVLHVSATDLAFQFVLLPAAFMPAIATIIVRKWVTHEGFTDAGLRPISGEHGRTTCLPPSCHCSWSA